MRPSSTVLVGIVKLLVGAYARWIGSSPAPAQRIYFANHTSHIDTLAIWSEDMVDEGHGLTPAKYGDPWSKLPKVRVGKQQVVTTGVPGSPYGRQQVFLRQGNTKHLVTVTNQAWNLAWDMNTLLKFAGSCHSKK